MVEMNVGFSYFVIVNRKQSTSLLPNDFLDKKAGVWSLLSRFP